MGTPISYFGTPLAVFKNQLGPSTSRPGEVDWIACLRELIRTARSQLKYLPGWTTIGEILNCELGPAGDGTTGYKHSRTTPEGVVIISPNISLCHQCLDLGCVSLKIDHKNHSTINPGGQTWHNEWRLLLCRNGRVLHWRARYRVIRHYGREGFQGNREVSINDYYAESSEIGPVNWDKLQEELKERESYHWWANASHPIRELGWLFKRAVQEREERIRGMRQLGASLGEVLLRHSATR